MICPECHIDQQRIRLDTHLVEEHKWAPGNAGAYYLEQLNKLLKETGATAIELVLALAVLVILGGLVYTVITLGSILFVHFAVKFW